MNRKFLFTLRIISFTNELFALMWYIMVIIVCSSESITHCCCRIIYLLDKPYFVYYITICTTSPKKTSCSNIKNMIWLLNRKCKCSDDYWMNIRHLPSCLKYAQARNMKFSICKKRMIIKKSRCIIFMVVAGYEFRLAVASWHYKNW